MIIQINPTHIQLIGYENKLSELKQILTYHDNKKLFELQRFKRNKWAIRSMSDEEVHARIDELKSQQFVCLLEQTPKGLFTLAGLKDLVANHFQDFEFKPFIRPKYSSVGLAYENPLPFELRPYQLDAVEKLKEVGHGAVTIATGGGKANCILELTKLMGLQTVVVAPSVNIAWQLFETLEKHLGNRNVGLYGDGKKQLGKLVTVCVAQSLVKLSKNDKAWNHFKDTKIFCSDESHTLGSETLTKMALELFSDVPYRFFFSATQFRNDGTDLLLDGIIGPIVLDLSVQDLVDQGYLAKPHFMLVKAASGSTYESSDAQRMINKHLYQNPDLHRKAAGLANYLAKEQGFQVLVMIDHIEQFKYLEPYFAFKPEFAHGGTTEANKKFIHASYHKSDTSDLVDRFNKKEFKILVGTGAVSTGTDFKTVNAIINLQGGKSPVKFTQLVGRGTRKAPGKDDFFFIDFNVENCLMLSNHFKARVKVYKSIYDNLKTLNF